MTDEIITEAWFQGKYLNEQEIESLQEENYFSDQVAKEKERQQARQEQIGRDWERRKKEEEKKKNVIRQMKNILKNLGISMSVQGCGCCSSPIVSFAYQDEIVANEIEDCNFNTEED